MSLSGAKETKKQKEKTPDLRLPQGQLLNLRKKKKSLRGGVGGQFPRNVQDKEGSLYVSGKLPTYPSPKPNFVCGDSKSDVLRRKPVKPYERANQSRKGSAPVNVLKFAFTQF